MNKLFPAKTPGQWFTAKFNLNVKKSRNTMFLHMQCSTQQALQATHMPTDGLSGLADLQ